jgi:hypothetical protein
MKKHNVRVVCGLIACTAILMGARCGGKGYLTEPGIPGIGNEVPLFAVDGKPLPTVIASSASDQTTVVGGKATLGEAIASGQYTISLRHTAATASDNSTSTGTVVFDWESGPGVAANIDLGAGLGTHTFRFSR